MDNQCGKASTTLHKTATHFNLKQSTMKHMKHSTMAVTNQH